MAAEVVSVIIGPQGNVAGNRREVGLLHEAVADLHVFMAVAIFVRFRLFVSGAISCRSGAIADHCLRAGLACWLAPKSKGGAPCIIIVTVNGALSTSSTGLITRERWERTRYVNC